MGNRPQRSQPHAGVLSREREGLASRFPRDRGVLDIWGAARAIPFPKALPHAVLASSVPAGVCSVPMASPAPVLLMAAGTASPKHHLSIPLWPPGHCLAPSKTKTSQGQVYCLLLIPRARVRQGPGKCLLKDCMHSEDTLRAVLIVSP